MVKVRAVHKIEEDVRFKDIDNPGFLLSNKKGGFLSLSNKNISRYQGCYFLKQKCTAPF